MISLPLQLLWPGSHVCVELWCDLPAGPIRLTTFSVPTCSSSTEWSIFFPGPTKNVPSYPTTGVSHCQTPLRPSQFRLVQIEVRKFQCACWKLVGYSSVLSIQRGGWEGETPGLDRWTVLWAMIPLPQATCTIILLPLAVQIADILHHFLMVPTPRAFCCWSVFPFLRELSRAGHSMPVCHHP